MRVAVKLGATDIAWHYLSRGPKLAVAASSQGLRVNCALPSNTRRPESACKNSKTGKPVELHGWDGVFVPDTNSASFKNEVMDFLHEAKKAGCTSFQQDNPWFMYYRMDQGCYGDSNPGQVKSAVKSYYGWLHSAITKTFPHAIPMTYNKKFYGRNESRNSLNELAGFFTGVMAEVESQQNTPGQLYDVIYKFNERRLRKSTVTTLKSAGVAANQRHIASVYALGGHPIFPWDVFLDKGERMYGDIGAYLGYYQMVRDNPKLFNRLHVKDAIINHSSGKVSSKQGLRIAGDSSDVLAVLRAGHGTRVLHLVNWRAGRRTLKVQVPKDLVGGAKFCTVIMPDAAPSTVSMRQASPQAMELEVPDLKVWALISFSDSAAG